MALIKTLQIKKCGTQKYHKKTITRNMMPNADRHQVFLKGEFFRKP